MHIHYWEKKCSHQNTVKTSCEAGKSDMRLLDVLFRFKCDMIKYSSVRLVQVSRHFFAGAVELSDVLVSTVVWP